MASAQPTPSYPDGLEILRAAFASLAVGVVVCNAHGQLIFFNPEAERILGIGVTGAREAEWPATYGCYLPDMTTPMPGEELPLARALRGEDTARELIFIRNQRQPSGIWIDVTGRPLRDRKGALAGAVVVFSDVSMPQQLLRRTSAAMTAFPREPPCEVEDAGQGISARFAGIRDMCVQLCSAVEQTADSVIITDSRGVIQYVNPAFGATTGYSAAEVLGRT
ncbi:MAG: PAS domain S-box protein, partial [Acidobacteriia bacterium]|nr:PAS domain S-box protein [Terriglobia bacterium]